MRTHRKRIRINVISLGCSKNLIDSEQLLAQLTANDFDVVHEADDPAARIVVINTCGFIQDARQESIDTILQHAKAKENGLIDRVFVMGCLSQRYKDQLTKEIPEIDGIVGVNNQAGLVKMLGGDYRKDLAGERVITTPAHYAYLKISEGCDRKCSFCAIPLIRGRHVSRPSGEILAEARLLARKGVKEIMLIAQDLTYYGLDLYKKQSLAGLLEKLAAIKGLEWIRLHYLYPANFPEEIISLMKENTRICRYIDIPVQHISDKILGLMKRSHDGKETRSLLYNIRKELPDAAIRTTLIAGHPGETEKEYNELKVFISEFRFDRLGVFPYSHEEGTFGYNNYSDEIPERVKKARVSELMEIQQSISEELNKKKTGKIMKVVLDRREGEFFAGRTQFDSPEVDNEVLISTEYNLSPGNFYDILITGATDFDLFGKPAV